MLLNHDIKSARNVGFRAIFVLANFRVCDVRFWNHAREMDQRVNGRDKFQFNLKSSVFFDRQLIAVLICNGCYCFRAKTTSNSVFDLADNKGSNLTSRAHRCRCDPFAG